MNGKAALATAAINAGAVCHCYHLLAIPCAVAAGLLIACGGSSPSPTGASPVVPVPLSLSVSAPQAVLYVGESTQARALVTFSDGSVAEVTGEAIWKSSDQAICAVSPSGVVNAVASGRVEISATWRSLSASMAFRAEMRPIPREQYQVIAHVHKPPPTIGEPIAGVTVEITGGSLSGQVFVTDGEGRVVLPPVEEAGFVIYFKKAGYEDVRYHVVQLPRDASARIQMAPVPGDVHSSFAGSNACTELPELRYCDSGVDCRGGRGVEFPVYHPGELRIHELIIPAWGSPQLEVVKVSSDGRLLGWGPHYMSQYLRLDGGYRYALVFSGNIIRCPSDFKVVFTRPR